MTIRRGRFASLVMVALGAAGAVLSVAPPAAAAPAPETKGGAIIISREVPLRNALLPGELGRAAVARTNPGVDEAFAGGVFTPLADDVVASVTSGLNGAPGAPRGDLGLPDPQQIRSELPTSASVIGASVGGGGVGGGLGDSISNTINSALGTVQNAATTIGKMIPDGGG